MSAICGVCSLVRPLPFADRTVAEMLDGLRHRGVNRTVTIAQGAAFGRTSRAKVAEHADLVAHDSARSGILSAADMRLDNMAELSAALAPAAPLLSPDHLLVLAYRRWGASLVEHLDGEFAFALWDPDERVLVCARDRFGVRPVYYRLHDSSFLFSTEPGPLLTAGPNTANRAWLADYLAGMVTDRTSTAVREVSRLAPGHVLLLSRSGLAVRRYWELSRSRAASEPGDEVEGFRAAFGAAVARRADTPCRVGALLSGGLDSSSIVALAAPRLRERARGLPVFAMTFPETPRWDERRHVDAVLRSVPGTEPHFLALDNHRSIESLDDIAAEQSFPVMAPNIGMSRELYRAAGRNGVGVLLDGHGGDEVVSHGFGRLHELAGSRNWLGLWQAAKAAALTTGHPAGAVFRDYLLHYGLPGTWRRAAQRVRRRVLRPLLAQERQADPALAIVAFDLTRETDLTTRYAETRGAEIAASRSEDSAHYAAVTSPLQAHAFEVLDLVAGRFGIEPRYPFWDVKLVELCLSLPPDLKLGEGRSRLILRKAMAGYLVEEVRWRPDKLDFTPHLLRAFVRGEGYLDDLFGDVRHELSDFIDPVELARLRSRVGTAGSRPPDGSDLHRLWRSAALAAWLRHSRSAARPAAG